MLLSSMGTQTFGGGAGVEEGGGGVCAHVSGTSMARAAASTRTLRPRARIVRADDDRDLGQTRSYAAHARTVTVIRIGTSE